jgi:hypothetical protein
MRHTRSRIRVVLVERNDPRACRRRWWAGMADSGILKAKNIDTPDETKTFEKGKVEIVNIDEVTAWRFSLEPGRRWS